MEENVVKFATEVIAWKHYKIQLFATDVLNMMIDNNIIDIDTVTKLLQQAGQTQPKLPKSHITDF